MIEVPFRKNRILTDALHARFQGLAISVEYGSAAFDQPTIER